MSHVYGIVLVAIACGFFGFAYGYWAGRQHGAEHERTDQNKRSMEAWRNPPQPPSVVHITDARDQSIHTTTVHQYAPPTPASDPARRQLPRGNH